MKDFVFSPIAFKDVIVRVESLKVVALSTSPLTVSPVKSRSNSRLASPVTTPKVWVVASPSDTVNTVSERLKVPSTPAPSLIVKVSPTKVLPLPSIVLFNVPERFRMPVFVIVFRSCAFDVVVPAFVRLPVTFPSFANVPEVTVTSPEIVPAFVKVPADVMLPAISEFASTEITAFAFVPFTT